MARSSDDPVRLSLLPRSLKCSDIGLDDFAADDVGAFFLPAQDGTSAGVEQSPAQFGTACDANAFFAGQYDGSTGVQSAAFLNIADEQSPTQLRSTTFPASDGDHAALASAFFSGQNGGNIDMLNKAFPKGMKEANKFLPTNNSLLIDREATSEKHLPRDSNLSRTYSTNQTEEGRGNGRGRKKRLDWEELLEAETFRKSKLMVPEPEETGEIVDEMIVHGHERCLEEIKALRITIYGQRG
ncbi:hypothetical protein BAE44_0025014 [Dichanthelium oligosanthes]|uniref:Uncharacterized protein n=1 Tax=Dichanthelium oligosanthes TaxID=888268 RepID=A0A1E5UMC1_9POAL|nr:hypothetical protein BAE44_0025014 [Dichanthelium oligosanthes]